MNCVLAMDIGGTQIKSGLIIGGKVIQEYAPADTPVTLRQSELPDFFIKLAQENVRDAEKSGYRTEAVVVSTLGTVDEKAGCVTGACENFPALAGLPLAETLSRSLKAPARIINDVNAAALGEARYGAGRGLQHFFCVALGAGIGGAYVHNGQVLTGANGMLGEVGYLLREHGTVYEDRASARALTERCEEYAIEKRVYYDCEALKKDREGKRLWQGWLTELARGLCEITYVLDPGVIVIGGGMSAQGAKLEREIQRSVDGMLTEAFRGKVTIRMAALGNQANLIGAASLF